jgi:transcriptional regulator with XRE-family HTH domain
MGDPAMMLRLARSRAGFTQRRLAHLAGTSQATLAAYETGRKQPSLATLSRLLAACGARLGTSAPPRTPSDAELRRAGDELAGVIALAEELPFARERSLRYPRLAPPEPR